jgi:CBS domain-containing protein
MKEYSKGVIIMMQTTVKTVMTPHPKFISPEGTLKEAAKIMEELDVGVLPVGSEENSQGIITDRDIVIRAISRGKDPSREKVRDYMTPQVFYIDEDATLREAAQEMRKHQVSRLMVRDKNGKLAGIASFGCFLRKNDNAEEVSRVVQSATGRQAA